MGSNNKFDIPLNVQTIGIIIAALGSIAALISAWIQIAPGKPEVEARITSIEEFSAKPKIEGLIGEFTYKGKQIKRLVTLRVTLVNSGNKTIIGKGEHKNIIGNVLTLDVPSKINVVNTSVLSNEFNAKLANNEDSISVSFNQWRPTEALELLVYLKVDDADTANYLIKKEREIIDGSFIIVNAISSRTGKNPLIDYLPSGYVKGLKAFGYLTLIIMVPLLILLTIEPIKNRFQVSHWKKSNTNSFNLFVEEKLAFLPEEEQEQLKSNPELLNTLMWKQYDGDKHPVTMGDNLKEAILFAAIFFFVSLGLLHLFIALHYLY